MSRSRASKAVQIWMRSALEKAQIAAPSIPVIGNVTAEPLQSPADILDELARQIRSAVQWFRTVEYLRGHGVTTYIEIGPGRVLTGLVKRIHADAETINIGTIDEVEALAAS